MCLLKRKNRIARKFNRFLIILISPLFIAFESVACKSDQEKNALTNYKGYALFQVYNIGHGGTNYNIFPIDIRNPESLDERELKIKYCLILSFPSNASHYKRIEKRLKELNYDFNNDYILAEIDYSFKNKEYSQSVKEWNDSITIKGVSHPLKVYFPQNSNEIIKINTLNILRTVK